MAQVIPEATIRANWENGPKQDGIPYDTYRASVLGTSSDFWGAFTTLPGAGAGQYEDPGSYDYYLAESARIDEGINSGTLSPERERELRAAKANLDAKYTPERLDAATREVQTAETDADALAALQALERIDATAGAPYGGGSSSGFDNGRPSYDPTNEATIRREWENGPKQQGIPYQEYKQKVMEANPNGEVRYTSGTARNLDGTSKTYPGYDILGTGLEGLDNAGIDAARARSMGQTAYFDNVSQRALGTIDEKNASTDAEVQAALDELKRSKQDTRSTTEAYTSGLFDAARSANKESSASQARLTGAVDQYNQSNLDALDAYKSGIAPYQTEIAGTTYNAISADPEGLAAQRRALGMGQDIYGGSLDYTSRAAQAYANPEDVAAALEGLGNLRANMNSGGVEQEVNLRHARDDYATGGRQQQHIIDLALEQLRDGGGQMQRVFNRYEDISTPEMTAAERAILAQSQRQYAIQDKANRDATTSELEARGILSGAGVLAGQQTAQQRLGEERVAGTLGAQAQAVQRALEGMRGMESTAAQIRAGDQAALGIASDATTRLRDSQQNALQLEQAAANALRAGDLAAAQAYTAAAQRQREQGFAEEYARGQAADTASANNQATRVQGAGIYANQANAIRRDNDNINMFNAEQQGITDRYNTSFKQSEYNRLTGLQQDTLNNTIGVNQTNVGNEFGLDQSTQGAIDARFGRTNTATQTGIGTAFGNYGIDSAYGGARIGAAESSNQRTTQQADRRINTATQRVGLSQSGNTDVQAAIDRLEANRADIYGLNRAI